MASGSTRSGAAGGGSSVAGRRSGAGGGVRGQSGAGAC
jgi:hypothetical protein